MTEGIHRVDGLRAANVYVVESDDGLVVVDTGISRNARRILRFVAALGHAPSDVRHIVITHCDIDHIGGAAALRRATGAELAVHDLDAGVLSGAEPPSKGGVAMRLLVRLLRFRPAAPDRRLRDGDDVGGLRVLHVPGHTPGSVALVRGGVVLAGDALLGTRKGAVKPPDPRLAQDRARAAESADVIRATGARLLLPGHGAPARL